MGSPYGSMFLWISRLKGMIHPTQNLSPRSFFFLSYDLLYIFVGFVTKKLTFFMDEHSCLSRLKRVTKNQERVTIQQMHPFPFRVKIMPKSILLSLMTVSFYWLMLLLFLETGIATKLGCDDLETVTSEDIVLEVSFKPLWFFVLSFHFYLWLQMWKVSETIVLQVLKEIEKLTRVKKMMEEASRPF